MTYSWAVPDQTLALAGFELAAPLHLWVAGQRNVRVPSARWRLAEGLLKVSAVAKRASLPARTVRFYADSGLLKPTAHGKEVDRQVKELAAVREQLVDLARSPTSGAATPSASVGRGLTSPCP